jgi:hypothetical protein
MAGRNLLTGGRNPQNGRQKSKDWPAEIYGLAGRNLLTGGRNPQIGRQKSKDWPAEI